MAPIKKTRRRADQEIEEIRWWFSDVLSDRSHFFRYENVDYPELSLEELMNDDDFYIIDDEFLITHNLENYRRMDKLTSDNIEQADTAFDEENPRWQRFRRAVPVVVTASTVIMLIPALWSIIIGILSYFTTWFQKYKNGRNGSNGGNGSQDTDPTQSETRYFDEFTKAKNTISFKSPSNYLLQKQYSEKNSLKNLDKNESVKKKTTKVVYMSAKDTIVIAEPSSGDNVINKEEKNTHNSPQTSPSPS